MANENDALQQNNNNNSGVDAIATMGVTLTSSNAAEITDMPTVGDVGAGDLTHSLASDKDKVSTGGGDCAGAGETSMLLSSTIPAVVAAAASTVASSSAVTAVRGKLNDLVADLCINGPMGNAGGYGDYTNTRASTATAPTVYVECIAQHKPETSSHSMPVPTQNASSSFSFKHFLSSSQTLTAPSSTVTVTTIDASATGASSAHPHNNAGAMSSNASSNPLQTSTGARPKVPQSASLSSTSISSLIGGGSGGCGGSSGLLTSGTTQDGGAFGSSATKMKRSPRFSSFDSQASLAEYASVGADTELEGSAGGGGSGGNGVNNLRSNVGGVSGGTTGFRLYPDALSGESSDFFSSTSRITRGMADGSTLTNNSSDYDRHQYVPRSYSNYEMPMSASASPRRRGAVAVGCAAASNVSGGSSLGVGKEARPTRLSLNTNTNTSKLKLDLPMDDAIGGGCGAAGGASSVRPLPNNAGEFPAAAAAAALPDFVQDHWMDSWYAHDMHLNSPPNSPIRDFGDDVASGAVGGGGGGGGTGISVGADVVNRSGIIGIPGPTMAYGGGGGQGIDAGAFGGNGPNEATTGNSKMLPDFLSDGPIIHSSQRLADVTVGLPSNSIGSPDDTPMSSQLSRLRIENERLQRELNDARVALNEQTRRASDLERQLQERQRSESAYNRNMTQNVTHAEECVDKTKRRTVTTQNHVMKLKQQVTQLTTEVETLRRENESLREEGAVGGFGVPCCDRTRPYATETTAAAAAAAAAGVRGNVGRPSRTQQISRDLLRAASNAENNLRQLLVGVDNLRQMAADIESTELRVDYEAVSPDLFSVFDDCDEYEDYSGGPAL